MEQVEPPTQCPGCKRTRLTWYRYETLGARKDDKHVIACGNCGHNYLLDKRPEWGGMAMPERRQLVRKQGT